MLQLQEEKIEIAMTTIQFREVSIFPGCELTFWAQRCDQVSKLR